MVTTTHDDQGNGVTLGELGRNMDSLRRDLHELAKDVTELKVSHGATDDRTRRLETIVYGALATAMAGLITAVIAVVTTRPG